MIPRDVVRAWRPAVTGVREVFHARFHEHAYPRHAHDVWTVLIVDHGDIRYRLDRAGHGADVGVVTVLPPHVAHDGRAGPAGSFVKRVLYLDSTLLDDALVGHAVDKPEIGDRQLRAALRTVHHDLVAGDDLFAAESRLALALERLTSHLRGGRTQAGLAAPPTAVLAEAVRAQLDLHVATGITLAALADELSASRGHIVRTFSAEFGIPPHAYLTARRIERARSLLLDGWDVGEVAVHVGFYDQSHLTRHFRRHVGTTPGRFARSGGVTARTWQRAVPPHGRSTR